MVVAPAAKRVCLIGDSHLAAVAMGWKTLAAEYRDVEAVFLASPGKSMQHLKIENGKLVPGTDELARHFERTAHLPAIDASYDLYVVYGLHCSVQLLPELWQAYRAHKRGDDSEIPAMPDVIAATVAGQILRLVREFTPKPIVLMATPMPAESRCVGRWEHLRRTGGDARLASLFVRSCHEFAVGIGARFLAQPEETLASPLHTRDALAAEQARFSKRVEKLGGDGIHMGAVYGAEIMRALLRVYGTEPALPRQGVDSSGALA